MQKSSACLPSEGKLNNLSHVPNLGHVKEASTCSKLRGAGKIRVFSFLSSLVEASRAAWCGAPLEMKEGTVSGARVQSAIRLQCWIGPAKRPLPFTFTYELWMEHYKTLRNILEGQQFWCYLTNKPNREKHS
jgi:hypothetical protein